MAAGRVLRCNNSTVERKRDMAGRQLLRLFVANRSFTCSAVRLSYQHFSKYPNYCFQELVPSSSLVNKVTLFHTSSRSKNEHIIQIQDEQDFKTRVLSSSKPVIIDFFATWCGPCKLLMPRLESLVAVRDGKAVLAKVDIDELSDLAVNYGVEAVPTVVAMKNGKIVDKFVGMKDDAALQSFVDKLTG